MSRYDQPSEPDLDRYETKPIEDIDVPDFDAPESAVDPAEHAAHAVMDAVHAMRAELAKVNDLERAIVVKGLIHGAFILLDDVDLSASDKISECMERRR